MCEWLKNYIKSIKVYKENCEYEENYEGNMKNGHLDISITSRHTGKVALMKVTCNETTATLNQGL